MSDQSKNNPDFLTVWLSLQQMDAVWSETCEIKDKD